MRVKIFPLLVVSLICAFSAVGQTVLENDSAIFFREGKATLQLAVVAERETANVPFRVDLLTIYGDVAASASVNRTLKNGRQTVEIIFPIDLSKTQNEDLAWYRIRYRVGDASGIISVSQIASELFEMRIIATENVFAGMTYRVRVRAVNPFTEKPADNVRVETKLSLEQQDEDSEDLEYTAEGVTDADGFAVLDFPIPAAVSLGGDGFVRVVGRRNGLVREARDTIMAVKYDTHFLMMTDKPLYQPGQMLNIRGILLKGSETKTVLADKGIEFRIEDEDETLLFREKQRTSGFGVAATAWRIPANVRLGEFTIQVRDEQGYVITSTSIRVSRYDLPNFSVRAKSSKAYYLAADKETEVEVRADYLFGKPVTKGKVRVVEETSREWNYKEQKYDIDEGEVREGELDAEGKFTARFPNEAFADDDDDDDHPKYRDIRYAAYVTDLSTNRTEQRRFDIRVSREPIHVYLTGLRASQNPALPMVGYISAFYADGTPAVCDIEIKASEDDEEKFKTVARTRTNSYGAGKIEFIRPKIGDADDALDFRVIAKDTQGRTGTLREYEIDFDNNNAAIRVSTDKAIYKPGEMINVSLLSTVKSGTVYVDVVKGWTVIDSHFVRLENGRGSLKIPYIEQFAGELKLAAFIEDPADDDIVSSVTGIIFPAPQGVSLKADFDKAVYKPNEEATVKFSIANAVGQVLESALGIVIMDKAVEERTRTDAEFSSQFSSLGGWLGYGASFGSVNVKDLNELDMTKPVSAEMQLVAEIILSSNYYYPNIFYSGRYHSQAFSVFAREINPTFEPFRQALKDAYEKRHFLHPTDEASLKQILSLYDLNIDTLRDPWGTPYNKEFGINRNSDYLSILSAGPDKKFGTSDDFTVFTESFQYFTPMGRAIDTALRNYHEQTGKFVRDRETLLSVMGMKAIYDRWERPYEISFGGNGRILETTLRSSGPDRKFDKESWRGDDFNVWTNRQDIFVAVEEKIRTAQAEVKTAPMTEEEFRSQLRKAGITDEMLHDANGKPLYINTVKTSRFWDRITFENVQVYGENTRTQRQIITPVTQDIMRFTIRGPGRDGTKGNWDDITFTEVVHVLAERTKDDEKPVSVIQPTSYIGNTGAISGVVTDAAGAVIPRVSISATNELTNVAVSVVTNDQGRFLIGSLPPGKYTVRADATGFKDTVMINVKVEANVTSQVRFLLEAGGVTEEVTVTSGSEDVLSTTSFSVATTNEGVDVTALPKGQTFGALLKMQPGVTIVTKSGTNEERETPRLREYFPETLLWQPEVVTDADGKAEVKFRMADNITTWKMYTIASTKDGKIGFAEKEVTAFQSFFVDLDPPKFLTAGDEIFLPTQVRNYTEKQQRVDVTMDTADWFSLIGGQEKQVNVPSGGSENAVFGFRAAMPVKEGKQRVTAMAETESDAIERPVTVRPDGHHIVDTESRFFNGSTRFDVNFPANTLPHSHAAELKIYPNLMAHVAEAVEGLLQRPYGCGEQTISSTYPNLMILKFNSGERKRMSSEAERQARKNLQDGYDRLIGYQASSGGFTYWGGKDAPDLALTAYALRFLADAAEHVAIDRTVVERAEQWLLGQQRTDGSWNVRYTWEKDENENRAKSLTTYIARTLAMLSKMKASETETNKNASLTKALAYLRVRNSQIDDPYSLALFGLALTDSGDAELAAIIAEKLASMALDEAGGAYWNLESNTVFNGWGTAGRIETTALVAQFLMKVNKEKYQSLTSKAMLFLLKNKDRYGVWYSTQTTINVLDAFVAAVAAESSETRQNVAVVVNGNTLETLEIGPDKLDQIIVSLEGKLNGSSNTVELHGSGGSTLMAQVVSEHYISWQDAESSGRTVNRSRALELDYTCDGTSVAIMQEVTCSVRAERVGFRGYGMLLAEIGTPPGAGVSRESLEEALKNNGSISKYEILPDRIIFYMWARAGGSQFDFKFRPRYGINAQTPASFAYDYYNPEAQAIREPMRFVVK
ncbi:MAG: carboxypeptidase regulatory-like domain-containing protein [Acidobacteria bacterium]|nr:carboxypeptidase regulatory-like domain-containing protein [Acidobacteriota bacterium]